MNARAMTLPSRAPASAVAVTALAPVAAPWPLRGTSSVVHPRTDADFAMERYAGGDTAAFGQLYDALSPRLFGYLLRQTRDRARARSIPGAEVTPWPFAFAGPPLVEDIRRTRGVILSDDGAPAPGVSSLD